MSELEQDFSLATEMFASEQLPDGYYDDDEPGIPAGEELPDELYDPQPLRRQIDAAVRAAAEPYLAAIQDPREHAQWLNERDEQRAYEEHVAAVQAEAQGSAVREQIIEELSKQYGLPEQMHDTIRQRADELYEWAAQSAYDQGIPPEAIHNPQAARALLDHAAQEVQGFIHAGRAWSPTDRAIYHQNPEYFSKARRDYDASEAGRRARETSHRTAYGRRQR